MTMYGERRFDVGSASTCSPLSPCFAKSYFFIFCRRAFTYFFALSPHLVDSPSSTQSVQELFPVTLSRPVARQTVADICA